MRIMRIVPAHVQHWDDERNLDHGIIVTLQYGWSFEAHEHQGVKGFDTEALALEAIKIENVYPCSCDTCADLA